MDNTYLKEPDPFIRRWLEVIEDGSIKAILELLDSIDSAAALALNETLGERLESAKETSWICTRC